MSYNNVTPHCTIEPDRTYNYVTIGFSAKLWGTDDSELDERVHGPGSSTKLQLIPEVCFLYASVWLLLFVTSWKLLLPTEHQLASGVEGACEGDVAWCNDTAKFGHSQKLESGFTPRLCLDCVPASEWEKALMSLDKYSSCFHLVGTCMKPESRSIETINWIQVKDLRDNLWSTEKHLLCIHLYPFPLWLKQEVNSHMLGPTARTTTLLFCLMCIWLYLPSSEQNSRTGTWSIPWKTNTIIRNGFLEQLFCDNVFMPCGNLATRCDVRLCERHWEEKGSQVAIWINPASIHSPQCCVRQRRWQSPQGSPPHE